MIVTAAQYMEKGQKFLELQKQLNDISEALNLMAMRGELNIHQARVHEHLSSHLAMTSYALGYMSVLEAQKK